MTETLTSETVPVSEFVELQHGLAVPMAAVLLALELEEAGWYIKRTGPDVLNVSQIDRPQQETQQAQQPLTDTQREAIRKHKPALLLVSDYVVCTVNGEIWTPKRRAAQGRR